MQSGSLGGDARALVEALRGGASLGVGVLGFEGVIDGLVLLAAYALPPRDPELCSFFQLEG